MQTAFFSRVDKEYQRIPYRSVLYIVAKRNYSVVVTTKGQKILVYATLNCLEASLPKELFVRIHRSHIVCLRRIDKFNRKNVTIKGRQLPIGGNAYIILCKRLNVICNEPCEKKSEKSEKVKKEAA